MTLPPPDALHTTVQAAAALDVPASLIRVWRVRHRAEPADFLPSVRPGGRARPMWLLDELRPLADKYHATRHKI